jgi:hypothetical protein
MIFEKEVNGTRKHVLTVLSTELYDQNLDLLFSRHKLNWFSEFSNFEQTTEFPTASKQQIE